jgi:hypothetical protein
MTESDDAAIFEAALNGEDDEYLEAEQTLRRSTSAKDTLAPAMHDPDPIARLLGQVFLDMSEAESTLYDVAEDYLASAERWFAKTILGTPPVGGVIDNLIATFGGSLGKYLALRLVKVPAAPIWRQQVTLGYVAGNPDPAVTDALLRFGSTTSIIELQAAVAHVLQASVDSALPQKVAAERERLARNGQQLPQSLAALA